MAELPVMVSPFLISSNLRSFNSSVVSSSEEKKDSGAAAVAALYTVGLRIQVGSPRLAGYVYVDSVGESTHSMIESSTHRVQ